MKALVTGSTGFVGANLVEGLASAGHQARAMYRSSSRLDALAGLSYEPVIGDVLDPAALRSAMDGVDWVFHVAAVSDYWRQGGTAWLYQVNVGGTRNVLEAAMATGVKRVVFTSSAAVLGAPDPCVPGNSGSEDASCKPGGQPNHLLNESATFNLPPALWPYGHSKHLAERVVLEFVDRGLEAVILNPTIILGPRDLNLVSGSLIVTLYRHWVPVTPPGGVNYVDVADVVAGQIAAAERGRVGERYILAAHNLTHKQAGAVICGVLGVRPPVLPFPRTLMGPLAVGADLFNRIWPGEPLFNGSQVRLMQHFLFFDGRKARQELALGAPIPFSTTIERTFNWYRENGYL